MIIPSYNSARVIRQCLESLSSLDYPKNKYEVIVVDSGKDDVPEICQEFGIKCIRKESRLTAGAARNIGISIARGDLITFLDADNYVQRNWLKLVVEDFNSFPEVFGVFGSLTGGENALTKWLNEEYEEGRKRVIVPEMGAESCLVLKREVFDTGCRFGTSPQKEGILLLRCLKKHNMLVLRDPSIKVGHLKQIDAQVWIKRQFPIGRIHAIQNGLYRNGLLASILLSASLLSFPFFQFYPINLYPTLFLSVIFAYYELVNKTLKNKKASLSIKIVLTAFGVLCKWVYWLGYVYQILTKREIPFYD